MVGEVIRSLKSRVQQAHPRTRNVFVNTVWGILIKGGNVLITLLLVPLTIDYLSKETYGTWITISSAVTLLTLLDVGLGNGLRNKFSEAVNRGDEHLARSYVSTSYALFAVVQLVAIAAFWVGSPLVSWSRVFNSSVPEAQLLATVRITVSLIAVRLVLEILSSILLARQESGKASLLALIHNALILGGVFYLSTRTQGDLPAIALLTTATPLVVLGLSTVYFFRTSLHRFRPSWRAIRLGDARQLLSLGYQFFVVQVAVIVLYYTDTLLISHLFGAAEVTTYNIAFRYFNAVNAVFAVVAMPYWSAFTEAYVNGDTAWMTQARQRLLRQWGLVAGLVLVMILLADPVYAWWVGDRVRVPLGVSVSMGVYTIILCWNNAVFTIINGTGKIRLQLLVIAGAALLNVPLVIVLAKHLGFGMPGVTLATSLSLLVCAVVGGIQAKKLVHRTAGGIWSA